jgi:predicted phage-related endonuclease
VTAVAVPAGTHAAEWHEERLEGIGGSDAPIVLGLSSFMSGAELSEIKIRRITKDESAPGEGDLRRRLGNMLEDVIAELYEEETHRPLRRVNRTLWAKAGPAPMFAHLDRIAPRLQPGTERCPDDALRILAEFKTRQFQTGWSEPDGGWESDDRDRIPKDVFVQVQHSLYCARLQVAHVAGLFGLGKFRRYRIPADPETWAIFDDVYPEFWRVVTEGRAAVERGEEPDLWPVDGSDASLEFVRRKHPGEEGRSIIPNVKQEELLRALVAAHAAKGLADKAFKTAQAPVMEFMGNAVSCSATFGSANWSAQQEVKKTDPEDLAAAFRSRLASYTTPEVITAIEVACEKVEKTSRRFTVVTAKEK